MKLSVTIITLNEEDNIERALKSVQFAQEIIVVDSGSQDRTVEIAKKYGAKVSVNKFIGHGNQKNYAAGLCQSDWILNIDADEEVTENLKNRIINIINRQDAKDVYAINRLTKYCHHWVKHGGWFPHYLRRLHRKDKARWTEPHVHEDLKAIDASEGKIEELLLHYSFPTILSQVKTNMNYANLASKDLLQRLGRRPSLLELILKPIGKFIECFFLKGGMLDGVVGLIIAINAAHSMFLKYSIAYMSRYE